MTLTHRGLYLFENLVDEDGVTFAADSENASWPVENLADSRLTKVYRSADVADQYEIDTQLNSPAAWQAIVLPYHRLSAAGTIDVLCGSTTFFDTTLAFNDPTGAVDVWPGKAMPRNHYVYLADEERTEPKVRLAIDDQGNAFGRYELPRLMIAPVFQPGLNFDYGVEMLWWDQTRIKESEQGSESRIAGGRRRGWKVTYSNGKLTKAEAQRFAMELGLALGSVREFFFVPYPNDTDNWWWQNLWCRLDGTIKGPEHTNFGGGNQGWSVSFNLKEVIP